MECGACLFSFRLLSEQLGVRNASAFCLSSVPASDCRCTTVTARCRSLTPFRHARAPLVLARLTTTTTTTTTPHQQDQFPKPVLPVAKTRLVAVDNPPKPVLPVAKTRLTTPRTCLTTPRTCLTTPRTRHTTPRTRSGRRPRAQTR